MKEILINWPVDSMGMPVSLKRFVKMASMPRPMRCIMSWKLWSGWNMACKQVSGGEVRSMPVVSSVKPVVVSVWHMPNIVLTGRKHPYTVLPMVKCRLSAEFPNVRLRQQATGSFQKRKMYSSMVMVHNVNLFWKCREAPVMERKIRKMPNG